MAGTSAQEYARRQPAAGGIVRAALIFYGLILVLALLASYSVYLKYARLWELTLLEKTGREP